MNKQKLTVYSSQLRELVAGGPLLVPGTFYPFGALQIQEKEFLACYISGAAVSNSLGLLDEGYVSREDMVWTVKKTLKVADIPLIVDCDTGLLPEFKLKRLWKLRKSLDKDAFVKLCLSRSDLVAGDDKYAVSETVKALERAGAAAIHIEDQDWCFKRCGHLGEKRLVPARDMAAKIQEACRARKNPDFMIIARTDARAPEGFSSAVIRAHAYREAGADAIFPEALESLAEFREFRRHVPDIPLVANLAEQGQTEESITAQNLMDVGYSMILFPATGTRMMLYAFEEFLEEVKAQGTARRLVEAGRLMSRSRVNEFLKDHSKVYQGQSGKESP